MSDLSTLPAPTAAPPPGFRDAPVLAMAPESLRDLFATAGVARFEAAGDYAGLLTALAEATSPRDAIEWIWVKDLADLSWEARRLRGAKAAVLTLSRLYAVGDVSRMGLAEPDAAEVDGQAYRRKLDDLERLDQLVTIAGARRDAVLRELEQRRGRIKAMRDAAVRP